MAPEVIACDENPEATYDNRVSICVLYFHLKFLILLQLSHVIYFFSIVYAGWDILDLNSNYLKLFLLIL